jgi:phosphoribosylformylglycinamidine synthase
MWQLVEAIEGIAEACRALNVPITGGNVSLYNETNGEAIYPTPILGVVGVLDDASKVSRARFEGGDEIVLSWRGFGELGGSEYPQGAAPLGQGAPPD